MQKVLIALVCTTLIGLSGCAGMDKKAETMPEPAKPVLSAAAQEALAAAQADAKAAKAKNALWTTAEDALKSAETAAADGDSAAVLKQTAIVQAHVKLGMAQLNYPLIPLGN
jgi:hypothetical protein